MRRPSAVWPPQISIAFFSGLSVFMGKSNITVRAICQRELLDAIAPRRDQHWAMKKTFGDRLREARLYRKLAQPQLAKLCGWDSQSRISMYERGKREPKQSDARKLAQALNVKESWLWNGEGDMTQAQPLVGNNFEQTVMPRIRRRVPLVSWVAAGDWCSIEQLPRDEWQYYGCPVDCSEKSYALRVKGISMEDEFSEGDIIFVDPDIPIRNKAFVVVILGGSEATFKQYVEEGGQQILMALNPSWPNRIIEINESTFRYCGTVIAKTKIY